MAGSIALLAYTLFCAWAGILSAGCHSSPPAGPAVTPVDAADGAISCPGAPAECTAACAALGAACGVAEPPQCPCALATMQAKRVVANPLNGNSALTCADLAAIKTAADVSARNWTCAP